MKFISNPHIQTDINYRINQNDRFGKYLIKMAHRSIQVMKLHKNRSSFLNGMIYLADSMDVAPDLITHYYMVANSFIFFDNVNDNQIMEIIKNVESTIPPISSKILVKMLVRRFADLVRSVTFYTSDCTRVPSSFKTCEELKSFIDSLPETGSFSYAREQVLSVLSKSGITDSIVEHAWNMYSCRIVINT